MGDLCPCRYLRQRRLVDVLHELICGRSEKEAAAALGISRSTLHIHVGRLYRHLGASSRGEFMALMIRIALRLEPPHIRAPVDPPYRHRAEPRRRLPTGLPGR